MTDPADSPKQDYRDSVFLPKTDFPMKAGLPQKEPGILARWQEQDFYANLRNRRRGREKFILHDGPPYANGDMHIGHALNHILKDMVVRTQTLLGKDAPYVPGWDCHGLPIEWKVEEQYRKKKLNKDEVPQQEFRAECRAYAQHWVDTQREQLKRLGINADWDNPYLTMDFQAEATIVAELLKFAESGQLYRGAKPVMWSPVEKTALAEAEVEYEDIVSTQIDVAFEIVESPIAELVGAHAVIWTTTPWTIPVNQAIAYGPDVEYVLWADAVGSAEWLGGGQSMPNASMRYLLIAEPLLLQFLDRNQTIGEGRPSSAGLEWYGDPVQPFKWRGKGSDLAGTTVRHPMAQFFSSPLPFRGGVGGGVSPSGAAFAEKPHPNPEEPLGPVRGTGPSTPEGEGLLGLNRDSPLAEFFLRPRPMLEGDFVTTDSGTGLVHMAPDHGEDDFDLCKANDIDPVFAVEADGKYRADWAWLGGEGSVINPKFNAPDGPICTALREAGGLLAASADYKHSYPHSWRSKAKVIYRCTPQWFVPMDKALEPLPQAGGVGVGLDGEVTSAPDGSHPPLTPPVYGRGTLRETATSAIAATRFIPEKGRNRLSSMVEGRPDWVLSRQRAWGVPITLFVKKGTNQYLDDAGVNARIIAGIRENGVDGWSDERAQEYLGSDYALADYERVTDILDVWFDSGCTHAFVLESGRWPDLSWPADLYLEGSDQHRGWFQSSLLQSCGTRGRAPYNAVLTHGFTMDQKGMKMSKSLGNTINPLDLMRDSGADILRLWALTVDFTEDHRIGKEILAGVSDQYRKLRNTFRYLLGALDGFSDAEKVAVADMPELERYMLHLLADMDAKLKTAVNDFDFNSYVRLLTEFCNEDLSAFFFDIRKDCLYCDAATDPKRMAYRTVLDMLFHALVRYAAPVLVFTSEEVWQTRFPDADSVHFSDWPEVPITRHPSEGWGPSRLATQGGVGSIDGIGPSLRWGDELVAKWTRLRDVRRSVTEAIEPYRRDKTIGSSLEAQVKVQLSHADETDLAELLIVSKAEFEQVDGLVGVPVFVTKTTNHKCGRCWRHLPEVTEDGALCGRCADVVGG
ncbi:isoleucine--tRNA ligase [Sphingorhabdus sp.]|jgi:isoleucyl-tRNA synthetase|uniref:isoleucine--tRNA ligase n=1 Tax=Sphingorhabdus sp. TaxID=1902408 RepID=UPI0037C8606A